MLVYAIAVYFRIGSYMYIVNVVLIAATLDGSLGYLLPLPETTFRRLKMLQIKLVQGLSHNAGLNPKAFRCALIRTTCDRILYTP